MTWEFRQDKYIRDHYAAVDGNGKTILEVYPPDDEIKSWHCCAGLVATYKPSAEQAIASVGLDPETVAEALRTWETK